MSQNADILNIEQNIHNKQMLMYNKTMSKVNKIAIPAAGLGTRFLPATKASPKELLPIVDKPAIQYVVEEAVNAGLDDILFITGRNKTALENHFDKAAELENVLKNKKDLKKLQSIQTLDSTAKVHYTRQSEPLGLGHAILQAEHHVNNEPFAVILPDSIVEEQATITQQMIEAYNKYQATIVVVMRVADEDINKHGIIKFEPTEDPNIVKIVDMVEKPEAWDAPSNLGAIGRYVLTPHIFETLKTQKVGVGGEIQLTDAIKTLAKNSENTGGVYALIYEGKYYDTGDKLGWLKANIEFGLQNPELSEGLHKLIHELDIKEPTN